MGLTKYRLGELIEQRREKYDGISILPVRGVSRDGFIDAKQPGADKSIYNVFYKFDFVFNPARMEINSIALNVEYDKARCSSLYEVFFISRKDVLLPEYLNLFIKRDEFARQCEFIGWGSARDYCRVSNIADIIISLPPLSIQQKYVDIYNAMLANQRCYESGLEDLKLVCDAYVDQLRNSLMHTRIGDFLEISDERNEMLDYGIDNVRGVYIEKKFIRTKADMEGVSLKPYYLVKPDYFAYVPVTSRNGEKISLAFNNSEDTYICSSSYVVFRVKDHTKLLPGYLSILLSRDEFNRYTRFNSWGSARETFDWSEMCDVEIPIPDIKVQQYIVNIYVVYQLRKEINEQLKGQIRDICPILIKGSVEEA